MAGDSVRISARPVAHRRRLVAELIAGMTVAEKLGQLTGVALGRVEHPASAVNLAAGAVAPGVVTVPARPLGDMTRQVADIQACIAATSRLRIPALAVAQYDPTDLPPFPVAVARAATWNTDLVGRLAATSAAVLSAAGLHATVTPSVAPSLVPAPWVDVAASPGDDAVLAAELLWAHVMGLQGPPVSRFGPGHVAAALPDVGAVAGQPGRRSDHAWSQRTLRATVLAAAEAAVRAGAAILLPAPIGNDGVPAHADSWLLRDLPHEWNFDGVVMAALGEVTALAERYRVAEAPDAALALAIEAGVHVVVAPQAGASTRDGDAGRPGGSPDDVHRRLTGLLVEGRLSGWVVDAAVTQVLLLKTALGLFDDPPRDPAAADAGAARYPLAEQAVVESMVLLSDQRGVLPLHTEGAIAVVAAGPVPETVAVRALVAALASRHPRGVHVLDPVSWEGAAGAEPMPRGVPDGGDGTVIVLVDEPQGAERLIGRLVAAGRPCVVLVCGGDPDALASLVATTAAIVLCWQPLTTHATAVAAVLLGDAEPGGRLPVTIDAADGSTLFPLGHGTGYTGFEYSHLRIGPDRTPDGALIVVQCRVTNTGGRAGKEVVQVHVRDDVATVMRTGGSLVAFTAVTVEAGRTATVTLRVPPERVALWNRGMRRVIEPGTFTVLVGRSATDIRLRGVFTVDTARDLGPAPPDRDG